jgi:hypothetical protein
MARRGPGRTLEVLLESRGPLVAQGADGEAVAYVPHPRLDALRRPPLACPSASTTPSTPAHGNTSRLPGEQADQILTSTQSSMRIGAPRVLEEERFGRTGRLHDPGLLPVGDEEAVVVAPLALVLARTTLPPTMKRPRSRQVSHTDQRFQESSPGNVPPPSTPEAQPSAPQPCHPSSPMMHSFYTPHQVTQSAPHHPLTPKPPQTTRPPVHAPRAALQSPPPPPRRWLPAPPPA